MIRDGIDGALTEKRPRLFRVLFHIFMDLLFDCPTCFGPLIAAEKQRGAPGGCAHCGERVFVPPGANRARSVALLRDSEIMGVQSSDKLTQRVLRRIRPVVKDANRPLIATSARLVAIPAKAPPKVAIPARQTDAQAA